MTSTSILGLEIDEFLGAFLPCYAYQVFKGGDGSIVEPDSE